MVPLHPQDKVTSLNINTKVIQTNNKHVVPNEVLDERIVQNGVDQKGFTDTMLILYVLDNCVRIMLMCLFNHIQCYTIVTQP